MWKFIFAPKLSDVMTSPNLSANYGLRKVFGLKLSDVMTSPIAHSICFPWYWYYIRDIDIFMIFVILVLFIKRLCIGENCTLRLFPQACNIGMQLRKIFSGKLAVIRTTFYLDKNEVDFNSGRWYNLAWPTCCVDTLRIWRNVCCVASQSGIVLNSFLRIKSSFHGYVQFPQYRRVW